MENDHKEIACTLISNGADVNAASEKGKTPLGLSIKKGLLKSPDSFAATVPESESPWRGYSVI